MGGRGLRVIFLGEEIPDRICDAVFKAFFAGERLTEGVLLTLGGVVKDFQRLKTRKMQIKE